MNRAASHGAIYVVGRLVPSIVMVASTAIFTRMADPDTLSAYVLATSGALLGSAALFQWLRLSVLRYAHDEDRAQVIGASAVLYAVQGALVIGVGAIASMAGVRLDPQLIRIGVVLLLCQAWFDLIQELQRGALQPVSYSITLCLKAVLSLALGVVALYLFNSGYALVLASAAALAIAPLHNVRKMFGGAKWSRRWAGKIIAYGWPLSISLVLFNLSIVGDRFIIAHFLGAGAAGLYGPVSDLGRQTITTFLQSVTLASYPLAIKALKDGGVQAAREQLSSNAKLLLLLSVPCTLGVVAAAAECAFLLLGKEYRAMAGQLLPLSAGAAFFMSWQMFYFTQATQLGEKTIGQFIVMAGTAMVSLAMSFLMIPAHGLIGAGWAALAAQGIGLVISICVSRFCFPLPFPLLDAGKTLVAGIIMVAAVWITQHFVGNMSLFRVVAVISVGVVSYGASAFLLDAAGIRRIFSGAANRVRRLLGRAKDKK